MDHLSVDNLFAPDCIEGPEQGTWFVESSDDEFLIGIPQNQLIIFAEGM